MTLSHDVLQKIKEEHVEPKARWKFLLYEYGIWLLGGSLILVSGTILSLVLYILAINDWDAYNAFSGSVAAFALKTFPHALGVIFVLMVVFIVFAIRHTRRGYRYSAVLIITFGVGVSAIVASVLYVSGAPRGLDNAFTKKLPGYIHVIHPRMERWHHPEEGVLAGRVIEVSNEQFLLVGKDGKEWIVTVSSTKNISPNIVVRVIGSPVDEKTIHALHILPWERPTKFIRQPKDQRMMSERKLFPVRNTE